MGTPLGPKYIPYTYMDPLGVIVTIRNSKDYIRVLVYSYYTTITGWGVLLRDLDRKGTNLWPFW